MDKSKAPKHGPFAPAILRYMRKEGIGYDELAERLCLSSRQVAWAHVHEYRRIHADVLRRMRALGIDLNELADPVGSDDEMEEWDEDGKAD